MGIVIRDVRTILTAPRGSRLAIVKVETSEPGLFGLGCATFSQRHLAVRSAIDDFLKPFLLGKDSHAIEDLWQCMSVNAYWRNGPVLNNAISGVDMALWDIKGKLANMPLFQLLGGKCREAAAIYRHANGRDEQEVEESVCALMGQGYQYIRCQIGGTEALRRPDVLPRTLFLACISIPRPMLGASLACSTTCVLGLVLPSSFSTTSTSGSHPSKPCG
jgi:mannonate dehydratase